MCIAIYKPSDRSIDKETLQRCYNANRDGCGLSFIDSNGELAIYTAMAFDEFYELYQECLEECPDSPFLIHFRIATRGSIDTDNCHPFFIDDEDRDKVFMHNGTITPMTKYCKANSGTSDTVEFGKRILEMLPPDWMDNVAIHELIEHYIGWSKIVVMNDAGEVIILNEEKGVWDDGIWYSNTGYKKPEPIKTYQMQDYRTWSWVNGKRSRWDYTLRDWRECNDDGTWTNPSTLVECDYCSKFVNKLIVAINDGFEYSCCQDCITDFENMGIVFEKETSYDKSVSNSGYINY